LDKNSIKNNESQFLIIDAGASGIAFPPGIAD
jgi:hypothetical protein